MQVRACLNVNWLSVCVDLTLWWRASGYPIPCSCSSSSFDPVGQFAWVTDCTRSKPAALMFEALDGLPACDVYSARLLVVGRWWQSWTLQFLLISLLLCSAVPSTRTQLADRSFAAASPRSWNSVPSNLCSGGNWTFKRLYITRVCWINAAAPDDLSVLSGTYTVQCHVAYNNTRIRVYDVLVPNGTRNSPCRFEASGSNVKVTRLYKSQAWGGADTWRGRRGEAVPLTGRLGGLGNVVSSPGPPAGSKAASWPKNGFWLILSLKEPIWW